MARAGLPEANTAIAIVTARQTIGFGMGATALLGANRDRPRRVLVVDLGMMAIPEALVSYR